MEYISRRRLQLQGYKFFHFMPLDSKTRKHPPMVEVDQSQAQVAVLMVPFIAQGHLNQLLHLSRLISSSFNNNHNNIHIHYVSTPSHCRQAKLRLHGWNNLNSTSNIHFHEFSTPPFISPPPNPNSVSGFPTHLQPSFDASIHLREPVARLMDSLSSTSKRVVVIYDSLMGSVVQDFVSLPNAESYKFHGVSAFFSFSSYAIQLIGIHNNNSPINEEILQILPSIEDCFPSEFLEFLNTRLNHFESYSAKIYDTCRSVEGRFLDLLEKEDKKEHWALGPFNPVDSRIEDDDENGRHRCLEWLDKQSPNSVLYVSFGSTTTMSDEQIMELAIGLEKSKQKFLWVLRDADKADVFDGETRKIRLPEGFEESVEGNGLMLTSWAPQLAILGHPATGGFMSHCGWNSSMESITMGVPIATWPMHSDQPRNAILITHVLKIGLVVRDWASRDQLVTSSMVQDAVKKLMQTEEGGEMRKRAKELGIVVRSSVEEGGDARREMDSFIAHISR